MREGYNSLKANKVTPGVAAITLVVLVSGPGAACAQSADSSQAVPSTQTERTSTLEEVVVTGSSIRGIAPIGSNLVSVGRETLEKTAAINATELTNTVPAITTSGSAPMGENAFSYYSPQIHSLGGSASNTTLVIADGLRIPGGGVQFAQTDPNILPTSAIQRVEVLADGASSVYGSDAVAGVVNYILRRSFNGLELAAKVGEGNKWHSDDANGIWGTTWDTGGFYVAGQYSYQSPLEARSHGFLSMGDYRPVGGRNVQSFNCSPATIRTPASGANVYLSPSATSTVANVAANAPCNLSLYGDAIQSNKRSNVLVRVFNTFGNSLTATGTINYNRLVGERDLGPGTLTAGTAFGPASGRTGQINPFYQAPAGAPGTGQEIVNYAAILPGNHYGSQAASNDTLYLTGTAEYEFGRNWSAKLSDAAGRSRSSLDQRDFFCNACALLALNGTSQANGSLTASSIVGANVIALNTPLTAANALDVWQANGGSTSTAVLRSLYTNSSSITDWNSFNETKLEAQGPLMTLPAGPLRMALGAEYMSNSQDVEGINPTNVGNSAAGSSYIFYKLRRSVYSAYGEVVVPIVSDAMHIPLVRGFDLNISGRYDNYDDVGKTSNPKIAANWEITNGIRVRGNYATAFVAPPLNSIGIPSLGYQRSATGASVANPIFVPVSLYPEVRSVPGCATATTTCQIGTAVSQGLQRSYGIGPSARPQTGNSWSVGLDFDPPSIPSLSAAFTFWSNEFKGGVNAPDLSLQLNSRALHDRLTICPTGCTVDQINAFTNVANGGTLTGTAPATVYYLLNNDQGNLLNLHVQGVDFNVMYRVPTENVGAFILGAAGTYYTKFDQDFGDAPFSVLNTSGLNTTFPSIQQRYRFQAGWQTGPFSIDAFMNYTGSYRNWSNGSVVPVTTVAGIPTGGGDRVKSDEIFDLHAEYAFKAGPMRHGAAYIDIKNLLDRDPPFYSGTTPGIGTGGYGYNAFVSNPIGRVIAVGVRAAF